VGSTDADAVADDADTDAVADTAAVAVIQALHDHVHVHVRVHVPKAAEAVSALPTPHLTNGDADSDASGDDMAKAPAEEAVVQRNVLPIPAVPNASTAAVVVAAAAVEPMTAAPTHPVEAEAEAPILGRVAVVAYSATDPQHPESALQPSSH